MNGDPESGQWVEWALGALGLTSSGLGAWIIRTSSRQARLEQKLDDLKESTHADMKEVKGELKAIRKHLTGADL